MQCAFGVDTLTPRRIADADHSAVSPVRRTPSPVKPATQTGTANPAAPSAKKQVVEVKRIKGGAVGLKFEVLPGGGKKIVSIKKESDASAQVLVQA